MTRITVVRISVAEPKSDGTTKLAFKVDVVCSMLFTVFNTSANTNSGAFWTHKLFWLKLFWLVLLVLLFAIFHPAEVRRLTFEAHIVGALVQSKLL